MFGLEEDIVSFSCFEVRFFSFFIFMYAWSIIFARLFQEDAMCKFFEVRSLGSSRFFFSFGELNYSIFLDSAFNRRLRFIQL